MALPGAIQGAIETLIVPSPADSRLERGVMLPIRNVAAHPA
jgi:hypothetical protein